MTPVAANVTAWVRLPPGTFHSLDERGRLVLARGDRRFAIGPLLPGVEGAVCAMAASPVPTGRLAESAGEEPGAVAQLHHVVSRLADRSWLERTVVADEAPVASLRPVGFPIAGPHRALGRGVPVVLSRFASLRRVDSSLVVASPRSSWTVVLDDPRAAALVARLAAPLVDGGEAEGCGLSPAVADAVLDVLDEAGMLVGEPSGAGSCDEARHQALAQWSAVDLAFHAATRYGRGDGGYGGTFPLEGRFDPPAEHPPEADRSIALDRPEPSSAAGDAPSLFTVLGARCSQREHDDGAPITLAQLAEFLYRSAAVRPARGGRPYPTGGGLYELELYPVVSCCAGLEPGLYRYDAVGHRLGVVAEYGPTVHRLLDDARSRSLMGRPPQVLIVVAARFGRVMYKYEAIAYATVLKNVGALYQTMYCVATAMGLAPCALGGGSADAFCAAAQTDFLVESSVGEFLVGSRVERPGRRDR